MGQHSSECVLRGGICCGDKRWQRTANRLAPVTRARSAGPSPAGDGKEGFAIAHLLVWRLCGARLRFAGRFSALRWPRCDARMARWAAPKARQGRICKSLIANFAAFAARGSASLAAVVHLTPFGAALRSAVRPALFAAPLRRPRNFGAALRRSHSPRAFGASLGLPPHALRRLAAFLPRAFLRGIHLLLRALRRGHPAGPCALSGARRGFTTDKSRRAGAGNGGDAPCLLF